MRISDWSSDVCSSDLRQTRGSIINIASVAGLKGTPGAVAYNSSKSAVVGMTKCMALDFAASGVRVNCICPGVIDTPMVDAVLAHHRSEEHTSELQSLMRSSYAVFCLKKQIKHSNKPHRSAIQQN